MTSPPLKLTFDNKLSEHLAAARLFHKTTKLHKVDKVAAIVLVGLGLYYTMSFGILWWTIIWFPLAVAEWLNLFSPRPIQLWYWFNRNPKFRETYHLTFDDEGFHFITKSIDSRIRSDHYSSVLEGNDLFLLVFGTMMYSVIPKRAFTSEHQMAKFRSLVNAKIGKPT